MRAVVTGILSETVVLQPNKAGNLAFLGGLADGDVNKVVMSDDDDAGSQIYAQLPRPSKLPGAPKSNINKVKKDARTAFWKLWDGNFRAKIFLENQTTLKMLVSLDGPDEDKFSGNIMVLVFTSIVDVSGTTANNCLKHGYTQYNAVFSSSFKENAKHELAHRCFYQLMRSHATLFWRYDFLKAMMKGSCAFLKDVFNGDPKLLLDIAILECDCTINHPSPVAASQKEQVGFAQANVGEALEALGEFHKAALLYRHTAEKYLTPDVGLSNHAMLHEHSALAFKRDNQLVQAEEGYIRALHLRQREAGVNWDLNKQIMTSLLSK